MPEEKKKVKHKLGALRDDGEPVLGMKFENSRDKLLRFKSSRQNPYLKESLIRQVENHEGKDAGVDLRKEINTKYDQEQRKKVGHIHMKGVDARAGRGSGNRMVSTPEEYEKWQKGRLYAWCNECGERCYIYTVITGMDGKLSISRCNKCGTDCMQLTEEELNVKQEEGNGRKNN